MKQTNNWEEEIRGILRNGYFDGDNDAVIDIVNQELTNLLKTVAEAMGEIEELSVKVDEGMKDWSDAEYRANYRSEFIVQLQNSQIISNISEKYPEFKELVKGK